MPHPNAQFWRPGDGRSLRSDRVPLDVRSLGRMVPHVPSHEGLGEGTPSVGLAELAHALGRGIELIQAILPGLSSELKLTVGHYPEMSALPFGGLQRELLQPGAYFLVDSSKRMGVLYGGSSVESTIRSRLISHLFKDGRLHHAQQFLRMKTQAWAAFGYPSPEVVDRELRNGLWGHNRWTVGRSTAGVRPLAVELVTQGAFEIAAMRVTSGPEAVLARCIERFATEYVLHRCGEYPPLNEQPVSIDLHARRGGVITERTLRLLVESLDDLARRLAAAV